MVVGKRIGMQQAGVRREIARLGRTPVARQIVGCRAHHPVDLRDRLGRQRRLADRREPQRHIEPAMREIVLPEPGVLQQQRQLETRLLLGERDDGVGDMQGTERIRRQDAQGSRRLRPHLADLILLLLEVAEHLLAELEIATALLGQVEGARRAVEQAHAEARLQIADVARDQRARHAELLRRQREAAGAHHAHEALHGAEAIHR